MGTRDGSIIATIITTHMPRNDAAAPGHVCPGIRIHAIDIVQPPGIGIPPIADMDVHQTIVTAALAANSSAETPRNARWEGRSEAMRREISNPAVAATTTTLPQPLYSSLRRHARPVHAPTAAGSSRPARLRHERSRGFADRVALVALSEGGFSSVGHLDPLRVRRGLGVVVVVPVPPLVRRGLGVTLWRVLPLPDGRAQ